MSGVERKLIEYNAQRNHRGNRPLFTDRDVTNITADSVPRRIVETRDPRIDNLRRETDPSSTARLSSSPLRKNRAEVHFSDTESVSTIHSSARPVSDPKAYEQGMMKLKETILRQKQQLATKKRNPEEQEVRFLDPAIYNTSRTNNNSASSSRVPGAAKDVARKRIKATAPVIQNYPGCNEAQKPVRKVVQPAAAPEPLPPPVTRHPKRRVTATTGDKGAIITTSSWRQGAALTRKVLSNKTQETTSTTTSVTSEKSSEKSESVKQPKSKTFISAPPPKRSPVKKTKINKPPVEEVPAVKAKHYDTAKVQRYIENTRKQRKKQQQDEKKKLEEAEKKKEERLQDLYSFQKKALKRSKGAASPSPQNRSRSTKTTSSESEKENTLTDHTEQEDDHTEKEVPEDIPLMPDFLPLRDHCGIVDIPLIPPSDTLDRTLTEIEVQPQQPSEEPELLEQYLEPVRSSPQLEMYSEQKRRKDAIRQTALALRYCYHHEVIVIKMQFF